MGSFPGIYTANYDAIRSQWSGTSAPGSPVVGQPFYNTTTGTITIWNGSAWTDIANTSTAVLANTAELLAARGTAASLDARLSVSINDDGTLKGSAPVSDWWMTEADAVAFVDGTSFTVAGDKTAIYLTDRAVYLDQTTDDWGYVVSSSYSVGNDETTVVVTEAVVDSGLTAVEYGQPPNNAPNSLVSADIGVTVQGYDADTMKSDVSTTLTVAQGGTVRSITGNTPSAPDLTTGLKFIWTGITADFTIPALTIPFAETWTIEIDSPGFNPTYPVTPLGGTFDNTLMNKIIIDGNGSGDYDLWVLTEEV